MTTHAWVIGARGLLGGAIVRAARQRTDWTVRDAEPLPWGSGAALTAAVRREATALFEASRRSGDRWVIVWAAGVAVTSSPQAVLDAELAEFRSVVDALAAPLEATGAGRRGTVFFASSAGGIYAGSDRPPFDEHTPPAPISPYGRYKLACEQVLREFADTHPVTVVLGRIANLYGPGQRLDKMQGLISHLARAQFSPMPASIYVSLDTMRDYIFTRDCGQLICDIVQRSFLEPEPVTVVKNVASGQAVTIADLLGYFRILAKQHPHVMLGSSAAASLQAHDLRLTSTVWPEVDRREFTPLPAGIHATMTDLLSAIQSGTARP
ncbi:MAG: nucleoside-diphosphate sugar epimerase [Agromyces sp.]|nr:nucleoside-diphosphate sugar epimerase [Agromyces sp.]